MLLFPLLMLICLLAALIGIPRSLYFAFRATREQDPLLKKNIKRKAWRNFLIPSLLALSFAIFCGYVAIQNYNALTQPFNVTGEAVVKNDISTCDKLSNEYENRDVCYFTVNENLKDPATCAAIESQLWKDNCYTDLAPAKDDLQYCDMVKDPREKSICMRDVFVARKDSSGCSKVPIPADADECYDRIAIETHNLSLCEKAGINKSYCYGLIAGYMKDISICNSKISQDNINGKEQCIARVAASTGNVDLCDLVNNWSNKELCYDLVAVETKDPSVCTNKNMRDTIGCYKRVSQAYNDVSLCNKIPVSSTGTSSRDECKKWMQD